MTGTKVAMSAAVTLLLAGVAWGEEPPAPVTPAKPIASVFVGAFAYPPALIDASVSVHAIPFIDAEAFFVVGGAVGFLGVALGPRVGLFDGRRADGTGSTVGASLVGERAWFGSISGSGWLWGARLSIEATCWQARHFGLTARLGAGALGNQNGMLPTAQLDVGLAF